MQLNVNKQPYFYSNRKHISFPTVTMNADKSANVPIYRMKFSKHDFFNTSFFHW